MATRPQADWTELPCGCKIGTGYEDGEPICYFEPHDTSCEYYMYFINESQRQGKGPRIRSVD